MCVSELVKQVFPFLPFACCFSSHQYHDGLSIVQNVLLCLLVRYSPVAGMHSQDYTEQTKSEDWERRPEEHNQQNVHTLNFKQKTD